MAIPRVHIIGVSGNMGQRYKVICNYLGYRVTGHDIGEIRESTAHMRAATHFIVATPTERHLVDLALLFKFEKPILCEKPIALSFAELNAFEDLHRLDVPLVRMVNQYAHLVGLHHYGESHYNYFKTGKDGLAWDCINIIGLSEKKPKLENTSPIWRCQINGKKLSIADMDQAYISMIENWVKFGEGNWPYIRKAHLGVEKWLMY